MTASDRYARSSIVIPIKGHAYAILSSAVYACIELREMYPRGSEIREAPGRVAASQVPDCVLLSWHYMLGLTVFFLVWVQITARLVGKTPPMVSGRPQGGS